ncbi:unnamed protein product [Diatraea saccharalis]|uniref:Uncharacterized protein n=1 Tax=Diatraea saccharalis TaxID=40085 RepID=A0A9N9RG02_9NEOP|nr:unnamed protein product [Diatraea saccharalis]
MSRRKELNLEKCAQIQRLHKEGKSHVDIARIVKCSYRSVEFAIQRLFVTGPRIGRKDQQLLRESMKNRKKTNSSISNAESSEEIKKSISSRITRRRLTEGGLIRCEDSKKVKVSS